MSVKNFKFVSPGVFINEIDNSFIPQSADVIGPVVIGRAQRGLAMQPVKVQSYSEFVEMFGDTVPGNAGGDVYRNGNLQSPMYGTYAAKAFLRANVAPLTYVRLLGQQSLTPTTAGQAGWETSKDPASTIATNGGAYGLWVWPSSSSPVYLGGDPNQLGTLAGIWYINSNAQVALSGTLHSTDATTAGIGYVIGNNTSAPYQFTVEITNNDQANEKIRFNFDDSSDLFLRKRFNTNPQLASDSTTFFPAAAHKNYWLGESFEQELLDGPHASTGTFTDISGSSLVGVALHGVLLPVALSGSVTTGPHNVKNKASVEGKAGWFIGQDLGAPASFYPQNQQQLFRLIGRGHGEWLQKNCKVSISNIKRSTSTSTDYGTFSVLVRHLHDTDSNVQIIERFDNCSLDPSSPSFVARKIGDRYTAWDTTSRRLKTYGEYPNQSKFIYVQMDADVEGGATDPELLPFGYYGPPRFKGFTAGYSIPANRMLVSPYEVVSGATTPAASLGTHACFLRVSGATGLVSCTGSIAFPVVRLRLSASDGGLADPTSAYFGMQGTRTNESTRTSLSIADPHRLWTASSVDDPVNGTPQTGVEAYPYVFSLDDVIKDTGQNGYYYASGSRIAGTSVTSASYGDLLDLGYNKFTAPFWGGFDGFNILLPDPVYNKGIAGEGGSGTGTATENNSSAYYTWKRAVDTVADPEALNMNLLAAPGLTVNSLTQHMINVCEERADAMALVDLANVYIPPAEAYKSTKKARIGTTPVEAAKALRSRRIDSSYGATFYPWVQTRDENTGMLLWVPPTVAMMGVLASSEARSDLWFAPAGFNRGGLTDGAAGIPVTAVTEKLTSKERDTLYDARINPIASFPSSGIVVFGQKTLQERQSALDRINVRRLVIYLKKQISILSTKILFEQNVQATWSRFRGLIEPFLANVQTQFGITEYKLILDESTTTPDLIDQNILYAKIMVKPARAIEFIAIDFVIASTGASFDD